MVKIQEKPVLSEPFNSFPFPPLFPGSSILMFISLIPGALLGATHSSYRMSVRVSQIKLAVPP